jgi:hypothetical protein
MDFLMAKQGNPILQFVPILIIVCLIMCFLFRKSMKQIPRFFTALFDFSFDRSVATKIIKFGYGFVVVFAGLCGIGSIIISFNSSLEVGIGALIWSPFMYLIIIIFTRIFLETLISIYHISENTAQIAEQGKQRNVV